MRRAPGWTRLAGIALELAALAYLAYVVMDREGAPAVAVPRPQPPAAEPVPQPQSPAAQRLSEPMDFIMESADEGARYYRAADRDAALVAGFYSDGRVRLADAQQHRFAGMLQRNHADLLELDNNEWSELFVHVTPSGAMQLELRGGPYDARMLTCEPLQS